MGKLMRIYTPRGPWRYFKGAVESGVKSYFVGEPVQEAVRVIAIFFFPAPVYKQREARKAEQDFSRVELMHKKPDVDNVVKILLDACTQAGLWRDDGQVQDMRIQKFWALRDAKPGVHLTIEEI